ALPTDCRQTPCPGGYYCDLSNGACKVGCAANSQCPQPGSCDLVTHKCQCDPNTNLCNATCVANSTQSCGSSCTPCSVPANATATCPSGVCGFTCTAGY